MMRFSLKKVKNERTKQIIAVKHFNRPIINLFFGFFSLKKLSGLAKIFLELALIDGEC
jgi:hypothetical protein